MGGVKQNFGGIEHFIRDVRDILWGLTPLPPVNLPMIVTISKNFYYH
jgi:hypothetical protein